MENELNNTHTCDMCGASINEGNEIYTHDGKVICQDCCDTHYLVCEECNEVYDNEDVYMVYTDGYNHDFKNVCIDCINDSDTIVQDIHTHDYYDTAYSVGMYTYDGDFISERTYDNYYFTCRECGEIFHTDNAHEHDGDLYCECCYSELNIPSTNIYSYHRFNDWKTYKLNDEVEPKYYIGFELEIDSTTTPSVSENEVMELVTSNMNCIGARDGSLSYRGIELISHPQSYKYIMSVKDKYKYVFDKLIEWKYSSHDNGRCGLHFHITRPNDEEIVNRLVLIVENFSEEITLFSRRTKEQLNHWSQFIKDITSTKEHILKSLYFLDKNKNLLNCNRYHSVNTTNTKTVEFRFCRGTLNINTFVASVQLINKICELAFDKTKDINKIDWLDLISDDECFEYCKNQNNIKSHTALDNTKNILKTVDKLKLSINKLNQLLIDYDKWSVMNFKTTIKIRNIKDLNDITNIRSKVDEYTNNIWINKNIKSKINRINENPDKLLNEIQYLKLDVIDYIRTLKSDYYKHRFNLIVKAFEEIC